MKYYGKEKCRILKQIRAEIARSNDIEWVVEECPHRGDCKGTCPKCEAEVRELERRLEERKKLGKRIAVAGVAAGLALTVSGCTNPLVRTMGDLQPGPSGNGTTAVVRSTDTDEVIIMGEELGEGSGSDGEGEESVQVPGELPEPTDSAAESFPAQTAGVLPVPDSQD